MEAIKVMLAFCLGLILTVKGGDLFIESAVWVAERTGISSAIIGGTIVSVATTLPEFFVSTIASNEGFSEIAVGNAIGSYICNIAFILGLCSILKPIQIRSPFFGIKGIMMILYLVFFFFLSREGLITYNEGYLLIGLVILFIIINALEHKRFDKTNSSLQLKAVKKKEIFMHLFSFILGGFFVIYGAHILVNSGVKIANYLRIPKQVISLTFLAIGTSLPELVTSLMATFKGQHNISVGNIVGANILNVSVIMGASALVGQKGLNISKQTLYLDIPMAMLVAIIFVVVGIFRGKICRATGFFLLLSYIIYLLILF